MNQYNQTNNDVDTSPVFSLDSSDESLVEIISEWEKNSQTYHDELLQKQDEMIEYYKGNQTEKENVQPFNSDSVYNRIFEATETLVPIITNSAHEFIALPAEESDLSMQKAQRVQKVLNFKYKEMEVKKKLEQVSRDMILKRFGVLEWGWDYETDDIQVWVRDPRTILVPKYRVDPHDLPYVIKLALFDKDDIETFFPDTDCEDLTKGVSINIGNDETMGVDSELYQIQVVYTDDLWVWRQGNTILKKMSNPYWDYGDEDEFETVESPQLGKIKQRKKTDTKNHLQKPTKPFVFFTPFLTGDAPFPETSLAEIAAPIQDDINVAKRQILDNLRRMGNGQVYVDAGALSEEQAQALTNEAGLIIIGANLASENRIRREAAVPIPASHFNNLMDSVSSFDSVFGVHAALRGNSSNQTLGGQMLDRNQSLSRVQQMSEVLNVGVNRLVNGLVQMMKMYYSEEKVFRILGSEKSIEFVKFVNDDVESGIVIETKDGIPPTIDTQTLYNQAIQLWQLNAIDPETLFQRLQFTDPKVTAEKLSAWRAGELLFQSELRNREAQMRASQTTQQNPNQVPASSGSPEENLSATDRGTETAEDVMRRTREELSSAGENPLDGISN